MPNWVEIYRNRPVIAVKVVRHMRKNFIPFDEMRRYYVHWANWLSGKIRAVGNLPT